MNAAERILLAKAEADLDAGLAHLRERLKGEAHGPLAFLARGVEAAVMGGISALELRPRIRDDVTFLLGLAQQVRDGADPAHLAAQHVERVLRVRELNLVVKVKDPRFQAVVDRCKVEMARRLPDLARMSSVDEPADYDDLLRRAFDGPDQPQRILDENHALVMWIFEHAEANPDLLRLPRSLVPKLAAIGRDVTSWQTTRARQGIHAVWASTETSASFSTPDAQP